MSAEIGQFALILALLFAVAQMVGGLCGWAPYAALTRRAAQGQAALCALAFLALTYAYVVTDLSVLNVVMNSHSYKPLLYKISGVWGNHEGSLLLWVLLLALFGAVMGRTQSQQAVGVQGALSTGFIMFLLCASNPFQRVPLPPIDGQDLNPVLQDPALALHPPLLYMGYVGFSVAFSAAVGALLAGRVTSDWARALKTWVLFSWTTLSAGIALGSFWAYYELGWGGWWFWDPVENASLLPWLLGTALLHSVIVMEKRGGLQRWTILLAILTFSLSLLGTFLVRSGVLTSVHSFAHDPARGVIILILIALFTGGALVLYALRGQRLNGDALFAPLSRESALVFNNLLLSTMAATVLTGTIYPLLVTAVTGGELSVGPPYFHATIIPLAIPLVVLMAAGPFLPWKKADAKALWQRLQVVALITIAVMLLTVWRQPDKLGFSLLGMGLCAWLVGGTLAQWTNAAGIARKDKAPLWPRIRHMKAAQWSLTLAHAGLGIAIAGMVGTGLWTQENMAVMTPGDSMTVGRYTVRLQDVAPAFGPNYSSLRATIHVTRRNANPHVRPLVLQTEQRHYPVAAKNTTEVGIHTGWRDDIYVVLGGQDGSGQDEGGRNESGQGENAQGHTAPRGYIIQAWHHPLIPFLWLGFVLMTLGGLIGLCARTPAHRDTPRPL